MIFDMQDVGVRFYTYISTLAYVLEACAEQGIPLLLLDRPNPHDTIDGPLLKGEKYRSFISLLPIPAVHGLTLGEAALMMNGEKWLKGGAKAALTIIPVLGWRHGDPYSLPTPPSPNLRSDKAIAYYPTLCYFEGSSWSVGRGTDTPFEVIGYPHPKLGSKSFRPKSQTGATQPKHKGKTCYGPDLDQHTWQKGINLPIILDAYRESQKLGIRFFSRRSTFDLLAGNGELARQIIQGQSAESIRASWADDLKAYTTLRSKYLLYPDYPTQGTCDAK